MSQLLESGEMYLETIHILSDKLDRVRAVDIGEYMGFSKPSVSRALGLLKDDGYIVIDEKNSISLTDKGDEIAKKIYERHTLLTKLFVDLGVSENTALEDACKIEHVISDETFQALKDHYCNK